VTVKKTIGTVSGAGAIACCMAFLPSWEGMDKVARRDAIGTGHPITYCNGLTSHDGSVKVGQRFTPDECAKRLGAALPKYLTPLQACVHIEIPDASMAALLDAAYNAGPAAVCRSPMVLHMNAGDIKGGCNAFDGWYVRSDGKVRAGLVDRRAGEKHGDKRKSERALCLEGLSQTVPALHDPEPVKHWWLK